MEAMHIIHPFHQFYLPREGLYIQLLRYGFHNDLYAVLYHGDRCKHDYDTEYKGTDGISYFVFWLEVDEGGGDYHTDWLD